MAAERQIIRARDVGTVEKDLGSSSFPEKNSGRVGPADKAKTKEAPRSHPEEFFNPDTRYSEVPILGFVDELEQRAAGYPDYTLADFVKAMRTQYEENKG